MPVNFYKITWCNIPEDSHSHTCCIKTLKSHIFNVNEHLCLPVCFVIITQLWTNEFCWNMLSYILQSSCEYCSAFIHFIHLIDSSLIWFFHPAIHSHYIPTNSLVWKLFIYLPPTERNVNTYINTHSSVVYIGMSLGISLSPRAEQSTRVPSQEHPLGHALSIKHSPARRVRNSSTPATRAQSLPYTTGSTIIKATTLITGVKPHYRRVLRTLTCLLSERIPFNISFPFFL
jgi:hypothetical protein